jgi:hypothetical protein
MMRTAFCVLTVLFPAAAQQGPFGFQRGMTKDQVIKLVGQKSVDQGASDGDVLALRTAPKPHPAFEGYLVTISPEKGILRVSAVGVDIRTNVFGQEVRGNFLEMLDAVSSNYGRATNNFDFVTDGSLWGEPQYWMMGLLKKERSLNAYWISKKLHPESGAIDLPNDISAISLSAVAASLEKGYLKLSYEFDGWEAYVDAQKAKQNTVLK